MIYVTSDLHGYPLEAFKSLLEKAHFGCDDELYVIGDVIDRNGDGGIETLRWLIDQTNVHLLKGNHEDMLLRCRFIFEGSLSAGLDRYQRARLMNWFMNGGKVTALSMADLFDSSPAAAFELLSCLQDAPLYSEVTVSGQKYILTHAGIGSFVPGKALDEYEKDELLWFRPGTDTFYPGGVRVICGHTPAAYYDPEHPDRAFRTETWIDIDTGAADGGHPMLLRLGDEAAFYADSPC